MKKLFTLLTVILVSIVIGIAIKQDSGYILIVYKSWAIELGFWLGVLIVLFTVLGFHKSVVFIKFIYNIPYRTKKWFFNRQQKKIHYQTTEGLLKLEEGNYKKAERLLIKSAKKQNKPLVNYLTAAKAAQELSNFDKRDEYLRHAFESSPSNGLSIGLMQANLQIANQEYEAALATLNHLQDEFGINKLVLKQLLTVFTNLKDWHSILKLLPNLKRYKIYSSQEIFNYEVKTAKNYFNSVGVSSTGILSYAQLKIRIDEFYNNYLNKKARHNPEVVIAYLTSLYLIKDKYGETLASAVNTVKPDPIVISMHEKEELDKIALNLIDKLLKDFKDPSVQNFQYELIELFGKIAYNEQHIRILEKYLTYDFYNNNLVLLFVLGKIAIKHEDYTKAFQYLNQAKKLNHYIKHARLPIDYYLGYVLLKTGKKQESLEIFEQYFKTCQ